MKLTSISPNPRNPRFIRDYRFEQLKKSLKEFPRMMELRPIIVDDKGMILGGNMRYRALKELGYTEIPDSWVKKASELTEDEKRRFILTDNNQFGEWDWDILANEWSLSDLSDWGLDFEFSEDKKKYKQEIVVPIYRPRGEKPSINQLVNTERRDELLQKIDESDIPDDVKEFLRLAAQRFLTFNYDLIAEYYAHADAEVQQLMEDLALVIIDADKAIEKGFLKLREQVERFSDEI